MREMMIFGLLSAFLTVVCDARSVFCSREGHDCGCVGEVSYGIAGEARIAKVRSTGVIPCTSRRFKASKGDKRTCECDGELLSAQDLNYYLRNPRGEGDNVSGVVVEPENFDSVWNSLPRLNNVKLRSSRSVVRASSEIPARWSPSFAYHCASKLSLNRTRSDPSRVSIFYGMTLMGEPVENGYEIAKSQLLSLRLSGLLPKASLHVYVTHVRNTPTTNKWGRVTMGQNRGTDTVNKSSMAVTERLREIVRTVAGDEGNYSVSIQFTNQFEFPALRGLWSHAQSRDIEDDDDELLLYMHNKGVTHVSDADGALSNTHGRGYVDATISGGYGPRTLIEMAVFRQVVGAWPYVLALFDSYGSEVQHAIIAPSVKGISWYNFFWARPSYVRHHSPPLPPDEIESFDRHYYEYWLGKQYSEDKRRACETSFALGSCTKGECPSFPSRDFPDAHLHRYFNVLRNEFSQHKHHNTKGT